MTDIQASEFPFVKDIPKRDKTRLERFLEVLAVAREKGPVWSIQVCARVAQISNQRVHELMRNGQIESVEVDGHPLIVESSFLAWLKVDNKGGRPRKNHFPTAPKNRGPGVLAGLVPAVYAAKERR